MSAIKLVIVGARGRMGQALIACAKRNSQLKVVGEIDQGDDLRSVVFTCDAVIDFSSHTTTVAVASLCAEHKKALVVGTTGHSDEESGKIKAFGSSIPLVISSNYSTGVNTLFWLTRKAAEILG